MTSIVNILDRLARYEQKRLEDSSRLSLGLLSGDMGSILFLYEYSRLNPSFQSAADASLDRVLEQLSSGNVISTYCSGVSGCIVGMDALCTSGFVDDFSQLLSPIDLYIASSQATMLRQNHHDFLHGFIGLGFYWLMRYCKNKAVAIKHLRQIIIHLQKTCEHSGFCVKWAQIETMWVKRYNISLSHGTSGTLILLCRVLKIPELEQSLGNEIREMIRGVVAYILQNRLDPVKYGCWFASSSLDCEQPHRSRLAWCYGDLGVAVALRAASVALNDESQSSLSLKVLEYAAQYRRNLKQNYVHDACICHGAAGIGLIFREMARINQSPLLFEAANYWRNIVLRCVVEDGQTCYYNYYDVSQKKFRRGSGILEGTVGVASYLLNEHSHSSLGKYLLIT